MAQRPALTGALVLRVGPASPAVISAVRERMRALDSDIPVFDAATVQEVLRNATWDSRLTGAMIGIFALGATLLAVIGLYGVISYGVQQRRHEISVRVALGATKDQVMGMVFRQGIRLTALGVASGLVLAFALSRVLGNVLFGVSSTDPVTFVAVPALLACVALVAMYIPARRATRVDPIAALRGD
jgi:ABC-type antimicrobial peptide transport system permease subunit